MRQADRLAASAARRSNILVAALLLGALAWIFATSAWELPAQGNPASEPVAGWVRE